MGRTERLRARKKMYSSRKLDDDDAVLSLRLWLVKNLWKNDTKLKLRFFPDTGRGIASAKPKKRGDILISIPFNLMITYATIQTQLLDKNPNLQCKLMIHELLALFLVIESHGECSFWKSYLDSLPSELPALPWLADEDQIKTYPLDLGVKSTEKRAKFQESFERVKESIRTFEDCVLDENLFKWAYVLVNTRSVYIDCKYIKFDQIILLDEPSMALCPYLDMFNHHFLANSEAQLVLNDGQLVYRLKTLVEYSSHEQIYISYGSHDNEKLMMEYGFFIPGNVFDTIKFDFQTVLETLGIRLNSVQYKFVKCHNFIDDLFIGRNDVSYQLKALLFVGLCDNCKRYNAVIFGDSYPDDFDAILTGAAVQLLEIKLKILQDEYDKFKNSLNSEDRVVMLVENFLRYRLSFVNELMNHFMKCLVKVN